MNRVFNIQQKRNGFSLVELVVGIVVLAVALLTMNMMLISQSKDALEPIHRLRASQLGQSILQDILSRAYDQNSDHNGGVYRCGEIWGDSHFWYNHNSNAWQTSGTPTLVPCSVVYGIDIGEKAGEHQNFNDVDDFIENNFVSAVVYGNVLGAEGPIQIQNYFVKIDVVPKDTAFKEISVIVKTPTNEEILFSALKGNY